MTTANTITNISYTGTTQTGNVTATYGIPVTAHIWGAGGGSSSLYPGAGGGYSRVNFIANPGDVLTVAVGQGGGAGGVTAPPPVPPVTWSTRDPNIVSGQTLYPTTRQNNSALLATYGVWSNLQQAGGTVDTGWFVTFPVSGYYTITGSSTGVGFTTEPQGGGAIYISGTPYMFLPGNGGGFTAQVNRYIPAGSYSVYVSAEHPSNGRGQASGIAFVINETSPPKITSTPTGLPGASYIALLFNTRFPPPNQGTQVYAYGNGDSFLDQWGVWGADQNATAFTRTYNIYFPATANVIFQMSCNNIGSLFIDGNPIIARTVSDNPNTPGQAIVNVTVGFHTVVISATGTVGALNRVGVIFGTGDQTSYSGGRGGASNPRSTQGFGGGGGGATVLALNAQVIGVGAGGGGGAAEAPSNLTYLTTAYTGSTATQPFSIAFTPPVPPVVIAPGTSGYYIKIQEVFNDIGNLTYINFLGYSVVVNGVIVYMSQVDGGGSAVAKPPPLTLAKKTTFVGISYIGGNPGPYGQADVVQCWSFDYFSLNTTAITDAKFNGQNGQDEVNFNITTAGGGGGGGGGARGGNGGAGGTSGGGFSGHNGMSLGGSAVFPPTGRLPYTNEYYPGGDIAGFTFDTATATPTNGSRLPYRNPYTGWQPWMYQHAACFSANPIEYSVNFPVSGTYIFNMGADYAMTVLVDGVAVASLTDYAGSYATPSPVQVSVPVTAGTHTVSIAWTDDGGTAGYALTIAIPGSVGIAQGGQAGVATNGGNGFVVLEYQTGGGMSVKDGDEWKGVQTVYVKDDGTWKEVQTTYINQDGVWTPVKGAPVPIFEPINSAYGALVRSYSAGSLLAPPPPAPDYSEPALMAFDGDSNKWVPWPFG
jgi:hypothetical protein